MGDWRKAVVLAFSVHRVLQQQPLEVRRLATGRGVLRAPAGGGGSGAAGGAAGGALELLPPASSSDDEGEGGGGGGGEGAGGDGPGTPLGEALAGAEALGGPPGAGAARAPLESAASEPAELPATGGLGAVRHGGARHARSRSEATALSAWSGTRLLTAMAAGRARAPVAPPPGSCLQIGCVRASVRVCMHTCVRLCLQLIEYVASGGHAWRHAT